MPVKLQKIKRMLVAVTGFTILFIGILLILLPGPAFIFIPLGLAILATEFLWARKLLEKVKAYIKKKRNGH